MGVRVFLRTVRSLQLVLIVHPVNDRSLFAINDTSYLLTDFSLIVPRQHPEHFLADTRGTRGWLSAPRAPVGPAGGKGTGTALGARGGRGSPRRLSPASLPRGCCVRTFRQRRERCRGGSRTPCPLTAAVSRRPPVPEAALPR